MIQRLGLRTSEPSDESLVQSLLDLLQTHELDFHTTFRNLSFFRPSSTAPDDAIAAVTNSLFDLQKRSAASDALKSWLEAYSIRVLSEESSWSSEMPAGNDWLSTREESMKSYNPRFVLRQWVLEELIAKCDKNQSEERGEAGLTESRALLAKILEVCLITVSIFVTSLALLATVLI